MTSGKKVNVLLPVEWIYCSLCGQSASLGAGGWSREGGKESKAFSFGYQQAAEVAQPSPAATPHLHAAALKITPRTLGRWFSLKHYLKYLNPSPNHHMTFFTLSRICYVIFPSGDCSFRERNEQQKFSTAPGWYAAQIVLQCCNLRFCA